MITDESKICVYGLSGCGKSTLVNSLIRGMERVIVIDSMKEYRGNDYYIGSDGIHDFYEKIKAGLLEPTETIRLSFFPGDEEEIGLLCNYLKELKYPCSVVFEEYHIYTSPNKLQKEISEYIFTGRHWGGGYIACTQRLNSAHKAFLSQASHIFTGEIFLNSDRKIMQEEGVVLDENNRLPEYGFYYYNRFNRTQIVVNNHLIE